MSKGRKASLIYAMGLSFGLVFWGIIAASGMGAILQSSVYVLMVLKVFGGLYLLRLAYVSAKASFSSEQDTFEPNDSASTGSAWFVRGLLLNLSNPKSVIAWMAALSVGMGNDGNLFALFAAFLLCVVLGFIINAMYSICFSFSGVMNAYKKAKRWVNGVSSVLFSIAGLGLLRSAFQRNPSG
ncbi:LysE family translocator [Marinomonas sp. GJ51-6]|uniref:LysE family translocator n=1 Tax=Marinomonas sp. GJ51-6 TaxID=2992802 RepID=UPI002934407E|nr:LysE family translocator [Marinomonas sp. GJ51-6]WOD07823.1 LysE family translocator [Marinomonas sp. GJ51-6]